MPGLEETGMGLKNYLDMETTQVKHVERNRNGPVRKFSWLAEWTSKWRRAAGDKK